MTRILFVTSELPDLFGSRFGLHPTDEVPLLVSAAYPGHLNPWILRLPRRVRWWALRRLLQIQKQPADAFDKLAKLSDIAPQLLSALSQEQWQAMVLTEKALEPWLDYLPTCGVKLAYLPDAAAPEVQALVERAIDVKKRGPFKVLFDLR